MWSQQHAKQTKIFFFFFNLNVVLKLSSVTTLESFCTRNAAVSGGFTQGYWQHCLWITDFTRAITHCNSLYLTADFRGNKLYPMNIQRGDGKQTIHWWVTERSRGWTHRHKHPCFRLLLARLQQIDSMASRLFWTNSPVFEVCLTNPNKNNRITPHLVASGPVFLSSFH